jgi:beta-galactosidase
MKQLPLKRLSFPILAILLCVPCLIGNAKENTGHRHVIALDGTWQIAEGKMDAVPTTFDRTVAVPGLVSLAHPAFIEPGPKVADRQSVPQKDPRRDAFWYRRTFKVDGSIPETATLKVGKAMFGTRVILNGQLLGDHLPCFTPGYFDAKKALKIGKNELLIRVGADRDSVTQAIPSGFDFEKERYIPGIFDSVELILAGTPNILNAQVVPDISKGQARVRLWLKGANDGDVTIKIREAKSGKVAGQASKRITAADQVVDLVVPISNCQLWSPEHPFLYTLSARTSGDELTTRFGMREFKFDPVTGRAMLNGKPYFMRGSNFTLYRFFEDGACQDLPWNEKWVRQLHQKVKDMHWNCLRYCIGFPPEEWYRIADEEGILIEDEFPIWFGGTGWSKWPPQLKRDELAAEYAEEMREQWNHPCVVIWDASNETTSTETAPAIQQVRALDLSDRPWDNSYTAPLQPGDMFEAHPYHFQNADFKLAGLAKADPVPQGNANHNDGKHAVVINEYGWLWLNRDGTPTTLTQKLYRNLLGPQSTTAQRRHLYATYLAAETEFFRSQRTAAAVMHFTALGYSRPDGQTSDHWLDVKELKWEPEFYRYVRDSFAPVGLNIQFWNDKAIAGTKIQLPIVLVNDLDETWSGPVTLRMKSADHEVLKLSQAEHLEALGKTTVYFNFTLPALTGPCTLEAELRGFDGKTVHCTREFQSVWGGVENTSRISP